MGGKDLDFVEDYKYWGITIDEKLTFKNHLNKLIKSVSFKTFQLSKIRSCLTKDTTSLLYKTMILTIIDYGDIFYGHANPCETDFKITKII